MVNKLKKKILSFRNGIVNLIKWLPVIWRDRQWDEAYIYIVIHRKLELMEEFFRSDKVFSASSEEMADQMKQVKDALSRLIKNQYLAEETKEYDDMFGHLPLFEFEDIGTKGAKQLVDSRPDEAQKMFREAGKRAEQREYEDKVFVFDFMKEHINGWWD